VGDDWSRTAEVCAGVEPDFVSSCFRSFGRDVSSRTDREPEKVAELCVIARQYGGEDECVEAAAYDMTANFSNPDRARALCESVRADIRGSCYYGLGTILGRFRMTAETRVADCEALTSDAALVAECVRGGWENLPKDPSG
jgi:hypothetical protein